VSHRSKVMALALRSLRLSGAKNSGSCAILISDARYSTQGREGQGSTEKVDIKKLFDNLAQKGNEEASKPQTPVKSLWSFLKENKGSSPILEPKKKHLDELKYFNEYPKKIRHWVEDAKIAPGYLIFCKISFQRSILHKRPVDEGEYIESPFVI
jgi:hypothetical protein